MREIKIAAALLGPIQKMGFAHANHNRYCSGRADGK
jgi:hypothetical protein